MGDFLAGGELVVVETEDDHFLGTAEVQDGVLIVRSGYAGRPVLLALEDVRSITPADEHVLIDHGDAETDDFLAVWAAHPEP